MTGQGFGRWKSVADEPLSGGNATVWICENEAGDRAAVKVLNRATRDDEKHLRFLDEIDILSRLSGRPGVLPILDFSIPDEPTKRDRPWFAMPVAAALDAHLDGAPLEDVVRSVAGLAETLRGLHGEGIFHRDLKPANLYWFEGTATLGDFGLVDFPDKQDLTTDQRQVGAANFVAPEMRDDPVNADPGPADVYSLAKTLWAIAVGRKWPPFGPQTSIDPRETIAGLTHEPRSVQVDELIGRCTSNFPEERPTMAAVADELAAWCDPPPPPPGVPDLREYEPLLRTPAEQKRDDTARDEEHALRVKETSRVMAEATNPIGKALATIGVGDGEPKVSTLSFPQQVLEESEITVLNGLPDLYAYNVEGPWWLTVHFGAIQVTSDDLVVVSVAGLSEGGPPSAMAPAAERRFHTLHSSISARLPIGSAQAEREVEREAAALVEQLPSWMKRWKELAHPE